jgi:hypothetical protein
MCHGHCPSTTTEEVFGRPGKQKILVLEAAAAAIHVALDVVVAMAAAIMWFQVTRDTTLGGMWNLFQLALHSDVLKSINFEGRLTF